MGRIKDQKELVAIRDLATKLDSFTLDIRRAFGPLSNVLVSFKAIQDAAEDADDTGVIGDQKTAAIDSIKADIQRMDGPTRTVVKDFLTQLGS